MGNYNDYVYVAPPIKQGNVQIAPYKPVNPPIDHVEQTTLAESTFTQYLMQQLKDGKDSAEKAQERKDRIAQQKREEEFRLEQEKIKAKTEEQKTKVDLERVKMEQDVVTNKFNMAVKIQDKVQEREERRKSEERLDSFHSYIFTLIFLSFLAVCGTLSYILPELKDVFVEYFKFKAGFK
jgi:hypothetical protein